MAFRSALFSELASACLGAETSSHFLPTQRQSPQVPPTAPGGERLSSLCLFPVILKSFPGPRGRHGHWNWVLVVSPAGWRYESPSRPSSCPRQHDTRRKIPPPELVWSPFRFPAYGWFLRTFSATAIRVFSGLKSFANWVAAIFFGRLFVAVFPAIWSPRPRPTANPRPCSPARGQASMAAHSTAQ